jgi:hypothetical protein
MQDVGSGKPNVGSRQPAYFLVGWTLTAASLSEFCCLFYGWTAECRPLRLEIVRT